MRPRRGRGELVRGGGDAAAPRGEAAALAGVKTGECNAALPWFSGFVGWWGEAVGLSMLSFHIRGYEVFLNLREMKK